MSKVCQVTGARPQRGGRYSHSHRRSKRWFRPNLQTKRFWLESEQRWVKLRVSAKGIKTINRRGLESVLAEMRRNGQRV